MGGAGVCRGAQRQKIEIATSAMLSARSVGEEAERTVLSLSLAREKVFKSFYPYVTVDEPAVHLMPLHFLPHEACQLVSEESLRELGVAAKLEYARNRWLDEIVDSPASVTGLSFVHRLNCALLKLINVRYARVLDGAAAATFFPILADLHARHGLSAILDSAWSGGSTFSISVEEYIEHAKMRHGPIRAPLDAVLLLAGAAHGDLQRARLSWHNWALGVQFYDDALDIEEDFRDQNLSWVVARTLDYFDWHSGNGNVRNGPDADEFYEKALTEGAISKALGLAESFFAESARLAEFAFPSWTTFQQKCLGRARLLREDYEKLVAGA